MIEAPNVDRLLAGPLGDWLSQHEVVREEAKEKTKGRYFKVAIAAVIILPFLFLLVPISTQLKLFLAFGAAMGGAVWGYLPTAEAKKQAKIGINDAIAESLGLTYEHDFEPGQEFGHCKQYGLVPHYGRAGFEDRWSGSVAGRDFSLFEAHLEVKRGSGKNSRWVTVFRGAIITMGYGKPFYGTTLLQRAGKHKKFFGGRQDNVSFKGHELGLVDMVHPGFEDRFVVYSDDQTEARYLIDPTYVERLIAIEDAFHGDDIRSLFIAGQVVIAVESGNLFESGSINAADDRAKIEETVSQFTKLADLAISFNEEKR
ncbi:DUF3137 domain-containing protein [Pontixanthobacter aestiaquae]|uniref:DUF3137 domain-containing protein n=1 Tax=Pontixanthobacter aestiaquae TaxID=1509367 RepID=A0A844Z7N6_9SPHN|nr:DUF3137 domain-containing protein [Pontixanthobacter aestiaquae]MDN3645660.1 DUF3137 domain-containing protein [Pontixanthobacter aestiaquae]MXO83342.1 DUF3137 domain-containing protein [Pontixanthobacter aestiaquae]